MTFIAFILGGAAVIGALIWYKRAKAAKAAAAATAATTKTTT